MNRTRWFDIGAIALTVAIAIGVAGISLSGGAGTPAAAPANLTNELHADSDKRPLVLFIGDSHTAGTSSAELSYACRAAVQLGLLCALAATGNSGYISGGPANRWVDPHFGESSSFSERISHLAAKYDPAVVVLDGGRSDEFASRTYAFNATVATIDEVRRTWPQAKVILIRPRLIAGPGDTLGYDDDFIARLLDAQGMIVIDPLQSLIHTDTRGLVGPDGIHPNRQGQDHITKALVDALAPHFVGMSQ